MHDEANGAIDSLNTWSSDPILVASQFAYYFLLDPASFIECRVGLARRYPPHITLRGRFVPGDDISPAMLISIGQRACADVQAVFARTACLEHVTGQLWWYALPPESAACRLAHRAHSKIEGILKKGQVIALDFMEEWHRGGNYRPHVTVSFDGLPPNVRKIQPAYIEVRLSAWCLVSHAPQESERSIPHIVYSEPLAPSGAR